MDNKVNESPEMKGNRASGRVGNDSADSIRRGGGEDPRRYEAKVIIDRVVKDNDMSGYNHNATSLSSQLTTAPKRMKCKWAAWTENRT